MDALVDKNYKVLFISGRRNDVDMLLAWRDIKNEYYQHLAGMEGRRIIDLQMELTLQRGRVEMVSSMVNILALTIDIETEATIELQNLLNMKVNASFKFTPAKKVDELKRCLKRMTGTKVQIQLLESELEALFEKSKNLQKEPTREWFRDALITLQDESPSPEINIKMMTYDFCERLKRYNKKVKTINARQHGNK